MDIGDINVKVRADLSELGKDFDKAKQQSQAFEKEVSKGTGTAAAGLKRVETQSKSTAAAQAQLSTSGKAAAAALGEVSTAQQRLAAATGTSTRGMTQYTYAAQRAADPKLQSAFEASSRELKNLGNNLSGTTAAITANARASVAAGDSALKMARNTSDAADAFGDLGDALSVLPGTLGNVGSGMSIVARIAGSMGGAFGGIIATVAGGAIAIASFVGVLAIGINRAKELASQIVSLNQAIAATGNVTGTTAQSLQQLALTAAKLPRMDEAGALATVNVLQRAASEAKLSKQQIETLTLSMGDLAAAFGTTVPQAAAKTIDILRSGEDGARQLMVQFNALTAEEVRMVGVLLQANRTVEAQAIILKGLATTSAREAAVAMTPWQELGKEVSNAWKRLLDALANSGPVRAATAALDGLARTLTGILRLDLSKIGKGLLEMAVSALAAIPGISDLVEVLKAYVTWGTQAAAIGAAAGVAVGGFVPGGGGTAAAPGTPGGRPTEQQIDDVNKLIGSMDTATLRARQLREQIASIENVKPFLKTEEQVRAADEALKTLRGQLYSTRTEQEIYNRKLSDEERILKASPQTRAAVVASIQAYNEARNNGLTAAEADERALKAYNMELRRSTEGAVLAIAGLSEMAKGQLKVADAYLKGADAQAIYTDEVTKAQAAIARGETLGASAAEYARQVLSERASEAIKSTAARVSALNREVVAIDEVADAERGGAIAGQEAARKQQALAEIQDLYTLALASGNKALLEYVEIIRGKYLEAIEKVNAAELRRQAIQESRRYDPREEYQARINDLQKLASTGQMSATAIEKAFTEAYIKLAESGDSWSDGAAAGLLKFAESARNAGREVAQTMVQAFDQITDAITRSMLKMDVDIKSIIQDIRYSITRMLVTQNITGPIAGLLGSLLGGAGGGGGGGQISVGGVPYAPVGGAGAIGGLLGGQSSGGGLFGGLGSLLGLGNNLTGGAGSGLLGGLGNILNTPLFGAGGLLSSSYGPVAPTALGGAGSLGSGIGGLFGIGMGISQLAGGNVIGGGSSILGGALGLAALAPGLGFLGPIGMGIGLIGGILSAVLAKKPKPPQGVTDIVFNDDGTITSNISQSRSRGGGALADSTKKAAGAFGDAFSGLLKEYDLKTLAGFMGGYILRSQGKNTGDQFIVGYGQYNRNAQEIQAGIGSAEEAINILAGALFARGAREGTIGGLTATQRTAISNTDLQSIEDIKNALDFSKLYDEAVAGAKDVTAAEQAIKQINEQFKSLKTTAEGYGLDVDILNQRQQEAINKVATDFNEGIRRQLLALTNPTQANREELLRSQESRKKEAEYLNSVTPGLVDMAQLLALANKELANFDKQVADARAAFDRTYMDAFRDSITASEVAIRQIDDQFKALAEQAAAYGIDLAALTARQQEVRQKIATDFNESVRLAALQLSNPDQYQREVLKQQQDARMKEAEYLQSIFPGLINMQQLLDLNNAELSALEKTLAQANDNIRKSLQSTLDNIRFGDDTSQYTVARRYGMAFGEFSALEEAARSGQSIDYDRLNSISQELLRLGKERFSVTEDYARIATQVEDLYEYLIGRPAYADGTGAGGAQDWAWVGERGRELAFFSKPTAVVSSGESSNLTGQLGDLVAITRQQANMIAEMVKEQRATREELNELKRQQKRTADWDKVKGIVTPAKTTVKA